jgi:hypothetical protein
MKKLLCILLIFTGCEISESDVAPNSPLIVLTFDDGHRSIIDLAFPEMKKYNYPGVNFIPSGWIDKHGRINLNEARTLEQEGWETGGHSVTHANLTTIPIDSARWEISFNYKQLIDFGLEHRCFALPVGHSNAEINEIILEYFNIIRTSRNDRYRYPLDVSRLGYYQVQENDDANSLLLRVAHGIIEGESLIIFGFHRFTNDISTYITTLHISDFKEFLKGIEKRQLEVVTLSAAVDKLR